MYKLLLIVVVADFSLRFTKPRKRLLLRRAGRISAGENVLEHFVVGRKSCWGGPSKEDKTVIPVQKLK